MRIFDTSFVKKSTTLSNSRFVFSIISLTLLEVRLYAFRRPYYIMIAYYILPRISYRRKISQIFLPRTSNGVHTYM